MKVELILDYIFDAVKLGFCTIIILLVSNAITRGNSEKIKSLSPQWIVNCVTTNGLELFPPTHINCTEPLLDSELDCYT